MIDDRHQAQKKLNELIKDIRFAMFTTVGASGVLSSRPMTVQKNPDDSQEAVTQLWFFMSRTSDAVIQLTHTPSVNVTFADTGDDAYVSVSGSAHVVEDLALKERLWSKMNEAWFPKGFSDPDLALVRVEMEEGEYWNVKESKLVQMFKMAKAALSDEQPNLGSHGKLSR